MYLDRLKCNVNRPSTNRVYHSIWVNFNKFLIKLDKKPTTMEHALTLYCAQLIMNGCKSSTIKSYISAIKFTLVTDGYAWEDQKVLFATLTRSCKLINDVVHTRLPIGFGLLELILFGVHRLFNDTQPYLDLLYKTIFLTAYFGLLRVGEITLSQHSIKACDVHSAHNKEKILLVLYTSKTHGRESHPQTVKIVAGANYKAGRSMHFCPFRLLSVYLKERGDYNSPHRQSLYFQRWVTSTG